MNELIEQPDKKFRYTQQVPMKFANMVEDLLAWYRSDKSKPTWSWNFDAKQRIILFQKSHIVSIDIDGYIELTRTTHKWYEKLLDKALTAFIFLKMKGGDSMSKKKPMGGKGVKKY